MAAPPPVGGVPDQAGSWTPLLAVTDSTPGRAQEVRLYLEWSASAPEGPGSEPGCGCRVSDSAWLVLLPLLWGRRRYGAGSSSKRSK